MAKSQNTGKKTPQTLMMLIGLQPEVAEAEVTEETGPKRAEEELRGEEVVMTSQEVATKTLEVDMKTQEVAEVAMIEEQDKHTKEPREPLTRIHGNGDTRMKRGQCSKR